MSNPILEYEANRTSIGTLNIYKTSDGIYHVSNIMDPPSYWKEGILTKQESEEIIKIINRANNRLYRKRLKERKQ